MAIKKKVTYSVSYIAGTDTLSTKLNSILSDIVGLILSHNSGLSILDTITYGSERMTGAPLYSGGGSGLYYDDYNGRYYQSDLIFLGTSENNICLSLGFFQGELAVAMNITPKVEKSITDIWNSQYGLSTLPFYALGKASRVFPFTACNQYNYSIPYRIVNNTISFSVVYWNTEYSKGYSFINGGGETDGTHLVIFKTDEGNNQQGMGAAIWRFGLISEHRKDQRQSILAFSLNENLLDNKPAELYTPSTSMPGATSATNQVTTNARYDMRTWYNADNNTNYSLNNNFFMAWHTLGGACKFTGTASRELESYGYIPTVGECYSGPNYDLDPLYISALSMQYNLPRLESGQAYVRKMRIPGWNPECKGEVYLLWSPSLYAYQSGDIVEVGRKSYAIITTGAVVWAARVS